MANTKPTEDQKKIAAYQALFNKEWSTLIVLGGVGVGKTYLVKNYTPWLSYFIDEPTFRQHLSSGNLRLRPYDAYQSDIKLFPLEALSKLDVVIYDDYGTGQMTEARIEKMLYWINERQSRGLRTIITTNLTEKEFGATEHRIKSRLLQNSIVLTINWPDRRQQNITHLAI